MVHPRTVGQTLRAQSLIDLSVAGMYQPQVSYAHGGKRFYVDGILGYFLRTGEPSFMPAHSVGGTSRVATYIFTKYMGRCPTGKEYVSWRSKGVGMDFSPENLLVHTSLYACPPETIEYFVSDKDESSGERYQPLVPLRTRVPDVDSRISTHPTLSVGAQIELVQRQIWAWLQEGTLEEGEIRLRAARMVQLRAWDVRGDDIHYSLFGSRQEYVKKRIVTECVVDAYAREHPALAYAEGELVSAEG